VADNSIGEAGAASLAPALREMHKLQHLNLARKQHTRGGSCGAECAGDWVLCAGLGLMMTAHGACVGVIGVVFIFDHWFYYLFFLRVLHCAIGMMFYIRMIIQGPIIGPIIIFVIISFNNISTTILCDYLH
jgi:hypothetical protein